MHEPATLEQCSGCGGRNQPDASHCEFCARPLLRVSATRAMRQIQPPPAGAWIVAVVLVLALVSVLIVQLVARAAH